MAEEIVKQLMLPNEGPLMIALVGAGGKTTTMMALARAYAKKGMRVLITTTTRIYVPSETDVDFLLIEGETISLGRPPMGTITAMGAAVEGEKKLVGLSLNRVEQIFESGSFDILLVEADGSGGRPIKAPADHEPLVPKSCTHVIGVIGMDAHGQPMNDVWVHRLDRFLAITGSEKNRRIDKEALMLLIGSSEGLFKNSPPFALRVLLLNKCTDNQLKEIADAVIFECLKNGIGGLTQGGRL